MGNRVLDIPSSVWSVLRGLYECADTDLAVVSMDQEAYTGLVSQLTRMDSSRVIPIRDLHHGHWTVYVHDAGDNENEPSFVLVQGNVYDMWLMWLDV